MGQIAADHARIGGDPSSYGQGFSPHILRTTDGQRRQRNNRIGDFSPRRTDVDPVPALRQIHRHGPQVEALGGESSLNPLRRVHPLQTEPRAARRGVDQIRDRAGRAALRIGIL